MGPVEGCYKIGQSKDAARRKSNYDLPTAMQTFHVIASANRAWLERHLHESLAHRRVMKEWFRLDESELAAIISLPYADNPIDIPASLNSLRSENQRLGIRYKDGRGRPAKLPMKNRSHVRCTLVDCELDRLRAACAAEGESQNDFARKAVLTRIDAVLTKPKRKGK